MKSTFHSQQLEKSPPSNKTQHSQKQILKKLFAVVEGVEWDPFGVEWQTGLQMAGWMGSWFKKERLSQVSGWRIWQMMVHAAETERRTKWRWWIKVISGVGFAKILKQGWWLQCKKMRSDPLWVSMLHAGYHAPCEFLSEGLFGMKVSSPDQSRVDVGRAAQAMLVRTDPKSWETDRVIPGGQCDRENSLEITLSFVVSGKLMWAFILFHNINMYLYLCIIYMYVYM